MMRHGVMKTKAEIFASASVVGGKESQGPLGKLFDLHDPDNRFGMKTWEKAESEMQRLALNTALAKSSVHPKDVGALFAGDLLNQCVGSAYGLHGFDIPYIGLYGACSTCAESLLLSTLMVSHGMCKIAAAVTSSHYCSAERQYRTPLEYGAQRAPTAQWTVTGAGAFLVRGLYQEEAVGDGKAVVERCLIGRVQDSGVADAANMGAAMAPAALDTLCRFFEETQTTPNAYDLILTGDLGYEGGDILSRPNKYFWYGQAQQYRSTFGGAAVSPTITVPTATKNEAQSILLLRGSKGPQVKSMQEKLIAIGYNLGSLGADGDFGSMTDTAVRNFQAVNGLVVDGKAGKETLAALDEAYKNKDSQSQTKIKVTASVLNVRSGAGINYPVVSTVKRDSVHNLIEEKNGWGQISNGWISSSYYKKF